MPWCFYFINQKFIPSLHETFFGSIIFQNVNNDLSFHFQISVVKVFYFKRKRKEKSNSI